MTTTPVIATTGKVPKTKLGKIEIMINVLHFCSTERRKTKIMYGCLLNWYQVNRYLAGLLALKFLEETNGEYKVTARGNKFVDLMEKGISSGNG